MSTTFTTGVSGLLIAFVATLSAHAADAPVTNHLFRTDIQIRPDGSRIQEIRTEEVPSNPAAASRLGQMR